MARMCASRQSCFGSFNEVLTVSSWPITFPLSTTLSHSELKKPLAFLQPGEIPRMLQEQQTREDLLHDGMSGGECQGPPRPGSHPFLLQEGVGHGTQDDVVLPVPVAAPLEMIQTELGLEVLVLLLDRPALVRQPDQLREASPWGKVQE